MNGDDIDMIARFDTILEQARSRQWLSLRQPRRAAARDGKPAAVALSRPEASLLADRRGAVAFEMPIVYLVVMISVFLPLVDVAIFGFQFVSAWEALRNFGQYVQYNPPPDVTSTSSWASSLPTSFSGYPINNVQVLCADGNAGAGAPCTSANISTSPNKYYTYNTTVTVAPMVLRSVLCTSQNTNPCTFTLPHSERFQ